MPPPHSHSQVLQDINDVAQNWFNRVIHNVASLPHDSTPNTIWTRYATLLGISNLACKQLIQLSTIDTSDSTSTNATNTVNAHAVLFGLGLWKLPKELGPGESSSNDTSGTILAQSRSIVEGAAEHARSSRFSSFSHRCRYFPIPSYTAPIIISATSAAGTANIRVITCAEALQQNVLPEVLFLPSDRFPECTMRVIAPGSHGWVFVFRKGIERWFTEGARFRLTHVEREDGEGKIEYGIYEAHPCREASLTGPEFIMMAEEVRHTILTHVSQSPKGSREYVLADEAISTSQKSIPCYLLQCISPALTHENGMSVDPCVNARAAGLNKVAVGPGTNGFVPGQAPLPVTQPYQPHGPGIQPGQVDYFQQQQQRQCQYYAQMVEMGKVGGYGNGFRGFGRGGMTTNRRSFGRGHGRGEQV